MITQPKYEFQGLAMLALDVASIRSPQFLENQNVGLPSSKKTPKPLSPITLSTKGPCGPWEPLL